MQIFFLYNLLKGLTDKEGVPLLGSAICSVLLSVGSGHVDLFLGARERVHLQCGRSDVLRAGKKNLKIFLGEVGIEVHNLCEVDESNFEGCLRSLRLENRVDDLEEHRSILINSLLVDWLEA